MNLFFVFTLVALFWRKHLAGVYRCTICVPHKRNYMLYLVHLSHICFTIDIICVNTTPQNRTRKLSPFRKGMKMKTKLKRKKREKKMCDRSKCKQQMNMRELNREKYAKQNAQINKRIFSV